MSYNKELQMNHLSGAATEKQISFVRDLMDSRDLLADPHFFDKVNAMDSGEYDRYIEHLKAEVANVSKQRASDLITKLKALPSKRERQSFRNGNRNEDLVNAEVGMYINQRSPEAVPTILRVYHGQQSGRNLVKRLVQTDRPHPEDSSIRLHDWEYVGAAAGRTAQHWLRKARKMTLAEAEEFGRMSGSCCACGRRLDVPESVERGIGPVCASRGELWA